jgi:hypothetical protein
MENAMKKKTALKMRWSHIVNSDNWMPWKDEYGTKHQPINGAHYMMYNILRDLPIERGFDMSTEKNQENITRIWRSLKYGKDHYNIFKLFEPALTVRQVKEKADEALRLYNNS